MQPAIWADPPGGCCQCCKSNDSRHDQLLPAGHPDHGLEGVEKRVAKPACQSIQWVPFLLQSRCDRASPPCLRRPRQPAGPEPAVRTGALIGYARVSTTGQLLDRQQHALAEAGCLRVFADKLSGKNADRPELAACLDYLRPGDTLVVPSLDRLSRSLADLIQIVTTLRRQGVGFKSLHEALDTTTPGGRLVFHVFAALAEFIRELIVAARRTSASRPSAVPERCSGIRGQHAITAPMRVAAVVMPAAWAEVRCFPDCA